MALGPEPLDDFEGEETQGLLGVTVVDPILLDVADHAGDVDDRFVDR